MYTRLLFLSSGLLLMVLGVLLSFLPTEIASFMGYTEGFAIPMALQLLGAVYFGYGMFNFMSKGAVVGGIHGRPLVVGNFSHFLIAALALMKAQELLAAFPWLWVLTAVFGLLAVAFGRLLFYSPLATNGR
jgi:hypothetical protein